MTTIIKKGWLERLASSHLPPPSRSPTHPTSLPITQSEQWRPAYANIVTNPFAASLLLHRTSDSTTPPTHKIALTPGAVSIQRGPQATTFTITTPDLGGTVLRCDDPRERDQWVDAVSKAVRHTGVGVMMRELEGCENKLQQNEAPGLRRSRSVHRSQVGSQQQHAIGGLQGRSRSIHRSEMDAVERRGLEGRSRAIHHAASTPVLRHAPAIPSNAVPEHPPDLRSRHPTPPRLHRVPSLASTALGAHEQVDGMPRPSFDPSAIHRPAHPAPRPGRPHAPFVPRLTIDDGEPRSQPMTAESSGRTLVEAGYWSTARSMTSPGKGGIVRFEVIEAGEPEGRKGAGPGVFLADRDEREEGRSLAWWKKVFKKVVVE
ncbi:hypothetical protein HK101_010878 [Irineochytrium annulatum]|nr:hypothetical protein HK101_010878 [Irineochytrium annulatum]